MIPIPYLYCISKDVSPSSGDRFKSAERASFSRITALMLCIRARL